MRILRGTKKAYYAVIAAVLSVMAALTNVLQMVRVILMAVLELPRKALLVAAVFMGGVFCIACFFIDMGFLMAVANVALGCLIVTVAYRIFDFAYTIVYAAIGFALVALDFGKATEKLTSLLEKEILAFLDNCGDNSRRKDRVIFLVPFLLHKIHWLFNKLQGLICYAMYPVTGILGMYLSYQWIFEAYDAADYNLSELLVGWAFVLLISGIFVYFGHCLADAIRTAAAAISPLDDVFSAYANFFKHMGCDNTNQKTDEYTKTYSEETQHQKNEAQSDNPYYAILAEAENMDELKRLYRRYAKKLHPDVCKEYSQAESNRRQGLLNAAYEQLKKRYI